MPANNFLASTATSFNGQQFVITDKEVPTGAEVWVKQFTFAAAAFNDPASDLIIRFRDSSGAILGTAVMTEAQANSSNVTLTLDNIVRLTQGETYLFTTEFTGSGTQAYRFAATRADNAPDANWGGTTISYPIVSTTGWTTWGARTDRAAFDLIFSFDGIVYTPEPASALLLMLGLSALAGRRQRRERADHGMSGALRRSGESC